MLIYKTYLKEMLSKKIIYTYIKKAQLQEISNQYAKSRNPFDFIKKFFKTAGFLCMQGYRDAKVDIEFFRKNRNSQNLTLQQKFRIFRIRSDLYRLPPVAIIFNFPGGFPLIFAYIKIFPDLSPSWVRPEEDQQRDRQIYFQRKKSALGFFKRSKSIYKDKDGEIKTHINLNTLEGMSLFEQKKIAELCYGIAKDGTNIIKFIFRVQLPYFISEYISSFILKTNLRKMLNIQQPYLKRLQKSQQEFDVLQKKVLKQAKLLQKQLSTI